jgi:hypothetical protein
MQATENAVETLFIAGPFIVKIIYIKEFQLGL